MIAVVLFETLLQNYIGENEAGAPLFLETNATALPEDGYTWIVWPNTWLFAKRNVCRLPQDDCNIQWTLGPAPVEPCKRFAVTLPTPYKALYWTKAGVLSRVALTGVRR